MNEELTQSHEHETIANGPVIILLVVMLLAVLAGMFYWFTLMGRNADVPIIIPATRPTAEQNREPESTTARAQVEALQTVSPSDEVSAIDADIESTSLETLDAELTAIEIELRNALSEPMQ